MTSLKLLNSLKVMLPKIIFAVVVAFCAPAQAQQVEKLELVIASPIYNNNQNNSYQFELRGNLYPRNTTFACGSQPEIARVGRYLVRVRYSQLDGMIATWVITLNDGRTIIWDAFTKYEIQPDELPLSFTYEAVVLRSTRTALTDFTPEPDCFGGRLTVFFLP